MQKEEKCRTHEYKTWKDEEERKKSERRARFMRATLDSFGHRSFVAAASDNVFASLLPPRFSLEPPHLQE
jgi:hypothetical protein